MGVLQELGTPDRLRLDNDRSWGWPDPNTPGPKPASGLCGATNTGARGGNRLAKATKWDGKDGRESERSVVCAGQRDGQEGSSPSGARMRGAVSESGGNSSLAEERKVWRTLTGHEGESRTQPRATCSHLS